MRRMRRLLVVAFLSSSIGGLAAGCDLEEVDESALESVEATLTTAETFESGSKTGYAAADVTLSSGTWNLSDALLGSLASDVKNGAKAVRVRNGGRVTMRFDRAGAGSFTVRHATFGADGNGSFGLFASQDGGGSWSQIGAAVTTHPSSLATASFTVNRSGAIRFELRKLDGGSNRIDLDDVAITDYGGPPPPPPPPPDPGTPGADISVHTSLGLPGPASTGDWKHYLSVKSQYVVSYNSARKIPNWVSWELNSSYLGSAARQNDYRVDGTLPSGMPQASLADYSGSGWDRGHMCPSGDRTRSSTANSQTFYLTNMLPQASENNGGPWDKLETYGRTLAGAGKELFIVAGGVVNGGEGTIGNGVVVPEATFKVVVVLDSAGQGAADVTTHTRVIAVMMPNDNADIDAGDNWRSYRVSVDDVEAATGLDFLSDVAPSVEGTIEARVDDL